MSAGFVGILTFDIHLPRDGSLKGKRSDLRSLKADLQHRFGAGRGGGRPPRPVAAHARDDRRSSTAAPATWSTAWPTSSAYVVAHFDTSRVAHYAIVAPEDLD